MRWRSLESGATIRKMNKTWETTRLDFVAVTDDKGAAKSTSPAHSIQAQTRFEGALHPVSKVSENDVLPTPAHGTLSRWPDN